MDAIKIRWVSWENNCQEVQKYYKIMVMLFSLTKYAKIKNVLFPKEKWI